jgi:electron transfer flavoprotein beta subunit
VIVLHAMCLVPLSSDTPCSVLWCCAVVQSVTVTREVDSGLQTVRMVLPAVVSSDLRLNEPRFVTLPNIMKARKKQLEVIPFASLAGADAGKPHVTTTAVNEPPARKSGVKLDSVQALVDVLKQKGFLG